MNSVWAGVRKYSGHAVLIGCVISLVLTAVVCLREFLSQQLFNLVLGMLALPFVLRTRPDKKGSCRFAVAALLLMALSFYAPVNTLVYFALVAVLLYLAECHCGRINFLTLAVVILTMPLATYLVNTFSFPIRLWLASVCGRIFQAGGMPVEVAGNTFMYGGAEFTVDPACMGLNMLVTSFITGILLFGYYQKKCNREMPAWSVPAYLAFILVLNIFSNLVRMMLLVIFRVYPDTAMHDAVGIICMLAQVVLPAWLVCRFLIRPASPGRLSRGLCPQQKFQCGTNFGGTRFNPSVPTMKGAYRWFIQPACCVLLWVAALQVAEKKSENTIPAFSAFEGYKTTAHSRGIIKLESDTSLVYVKQIRWFCDTEHNPMTCWSGSGYQISQVQETVTAGGMTIYAGILQRGDDVLYTAWWYSNGPAATISQLRWRWDMLTGAPPYSLLNVTTADREALERETAKIARSFPAYGG
jgi:exosortase/archaeosortase family protein